MQIVTGLEYNGRQEHQKEAHGREDLFTFPTAILPRHNVQRKANKGAQKDYHNAFRQVLEPGLEHRVDKQDAQHDNADDEKQ